MPRWLLRFWLRLRLWLRHILFHLVKWWPWPGLARLLVAGAPADGLNEFVCRSLPVESGCWCALRRCEGFLAGFAGEEREMTVPDVGILLRLAFGGGGHSMAEGYGRSVGCSIWWPWLRSKAGWQTRSCHALAQTVENVVV